ncbi:MAG: macro domain-containing protein [Crenarchaeota archaeon]|nr:macro domain-containing protein [Thermoproteota archaeon]
MPLPTDARILCRKEVRGVAIDVVISDITRLSVDAIVNPANSLMIMGGGVAGAIKRAGGAEIEEEARKYAPVPVGKAIATGAGKLKAKYVIHAPTMERPAQRIGVNNVYAATYAAIDKAVELGVESVALPGMGTGVGGVPFNDAAKAMVRAILDRLARGGGKLREILLVAIHEGLARAFCQALESETKE